MVVVLVVSDGMFHTVEILDTAGSHHFPAMRELSIRSSRAFVLVFSVDNEQSFYEAMAIWELILKLKGQLNFLSLPPPPLNFRSAPNHALPNPH